MLAALRPQALKVWGEILKKPLPAEDHPDYFRILSVQKETANNIMSTSLKADENCLRQRHDDALDRLFSELEETVRKRGGIILDQLPDDEYGTPLLSPPATIQ